MKLDPECIRALLLSIEDKCTPSTPWNYKYQNPASDFISDENYEKIFHHILQLRNAGLISGVTYYECGMIIFVSNLTPDGDTFLANIRNESIWKKIISGGVNASLSILIEIAKDAALKHLS